MIADPADYDDQNLYDKHDLRNFDKKEEIIKVVLKPQIVLKKLLNLNTNYIYILEITNF